MPSIILLVVAIAVMIFTIGAAVLVIYGAVFWSIFRDAPFVPSPTSVADAMMDLAQVKSGELVVELGSGHGVVLFSAAKRSARSVGYELSPFLCFFTRLQKAIFYRHVDLQVIRQDLFDADIKNAQVVTCYLFPKAMGQLRHKFEAELSPGTRVVSAQFSIPGWAPIEVREVAHRPVYLYQIP